MKTILLLTCEHASNKVPKHYKKLFAKYKSLLASHQGYDVGASLIFNYLAKKLSCYAIKARYSRLLIDFNRSLHHPQVFSFITKTFTKYQKQKIIVQYYTPYRGGIENYIRKKIKFNYHILHISIHTFTYQINKQKRNNDIGLLYDPSRKIEKRFCKQFKSILTKKNASLNIRFNYPYRGIANGLTTYLRKIFPENRYIGIELEINQKYFRGTNQTKLKKTVTEAIKQLLTNLAFFDNDNANAI